MPEPGPDPESAREDRVNEAIAEYLRCEESGRAPDRGAFLGRYPDLGAELASFCDDLDRFRQAVSPLQAEAEAESPGRGHGNEDSTQTLGTPAASAGPAQPRRIGDYEIQGEIARGGMGVVYRAVQLSLNRDVAVKMILAGRLASPADVARFRSEAEAAARLDHPHVVPIYEVGEYEGQPYFSMKLVEGGDLTCHRERFAGDPRAAARLVATLADAIHHAHQRGILHRDLKPRNILMSLDGEPQITDFGLAKWVGADGSQTQSGAVVGTACYMAPEQARSERTLTTSADVYSLGAILYELLSGRPPFRGQTPAETLIEVLEKEPPRLRTLDSRIDRDLETICLKCLEKDPAGRYGSARALAEDLDRWLEGRPIVARPVGPAERVVRWCRRNPVLALAAVLIVSLTGFYVWSLNERNLATSEALRRAWSEERAAQEAREETQDALARSRYEQAKALSVAGPPGRRWEILKLVGEAETLRARERSAVAAPGGTGQEPVLPLRRQLRSEAVAAMLLNDARIRWQLPLPNGVQPGLTADTRWAISPRGDAPEGQSAIAVTDLRTGHVSARSDSRLLYEATAYALDPSGRLVAAFHAGRGTVTLLDWPSGRLKRELVWPKPAATQSPAALSARLVWSSEMVFSPEGRSLALVARGAGTQALVLWRLEDPGKPQLVAAVPENTDLGPPVFFPDGLQLAYPIGAEKIALWEPGKGRSSGEIRPPLPLVGNIAPDALGRRLALPARGEDEGKGTLILWGVAQGRELARIGTDFSLKAAALAFHPTKEYLAVGTADGRIFVIDLLLQRPILTLPEAHGGRMVYVRWSPDGRDLISWGVGGALTCRELGEAAKAEVAAAAKPFRFASSPDGKWLAVAEHGEGQIRLVDRSTGKALRSLPAGALRSPAQLRFSPDGRLVAAADPYHAFVWDASTGQVTARLEDAERFAGLIASIAFTPEGACRAAVKNVVENAGDSHLWIWDLGARRTLCRLPVEQGFETAVFWPDGRRAGAVFAGRLGQTAKVSVFEIPSGRALEERELPGEPVGPALLSPDGNWLAILTQRPSSPLYELVELGVLAPPTVEALVQRFPEGDRRAVIPGPSTPADRASAFSPDSRLLALGYRDGSVKVWNLAEEAEVFHVRLCPRPITQLEFSGAGRYLAVTDGQSTIEMIDLGSLRRALAAVSLDW